MFPQGATTGFISGMTVLGAKGGNDFRPDPVSTISRCALPMVRSDQASSLQRIEQISSLPSQHLEPPSLVWFDLRNLDDDGGQLGNFRVTRCRQSLESGRILRRDMRLLQVVQTSTP